MTITLRTGYSPSAFAARPGRRGTLLILSAYPLVQLVVHLALGGALEKDEAEQLLLTQSLALGYAGTGSQPPLYTWLQIAFFAVFGINIFALAALRATLQILTQVALFRSADLVLGHRTLATLAALTLWLIPQFSVASMRKTHSVLAICLAAAFLHALLLVWRSGRRGSYVWLGVTLGLGTLSKYNFALFAAAFLVAALSVPPLRRRLADRRTGLALAVALGLTAPHLAWLLSSLSVVTGEIGTRVGVGTAAPWTTSSAGQGLLALAVAILGYLGPLALHLLAFGRPREPGSAGAATLARLVERYWLLAFGVLTAVVVAFAIPRFHEHWLQPLLFVLPLYLFLRRPAASPAPRQLKLFALVLTAAISLLAGWRVAEVWAGHHVGALSRLTLPYREVGRRIAETGFRGGVIVTDDHLVGGNLRFFLPGSTVLTTRMVEAGNRVPPGPCLVVWKGPGETIPPHLAGWVAATGGGAPAVRWIEARGSRGERESLRLGVVARPTCQR